MHGRIGETVDLGAVVEKALLLAEHERRRLDVRVEVDRESGPPAVGADRVQIEQIPPGNVFHAVEGAERRRVSVTRTRSGRGRPVVEDSAPGLTLELREQVFEPFYTTRPSGLGVGPVIDRSLAERRGARSWAEPDGGRGGRFGLGLPYGVQDP